MKVIGKKRYAIQRDGKLYVGISLHCTYPATQDGAEGDLTESFSIGDTKPGYPTALSVALGSEITPSYNKYGKVDDIVVMPDPVASGQDSAPVSGQGTGKGK